MLRDVERLLQHLIGIRREIRFSARHFRQVGYLLLNGSLDDLAVNAQLLKDVIGYVLALLHHACQQVNRLNGLLTIALSHVNCGLNGFLSLNSKFVECHISISFLLFSCYVLSFSALFISKVMPQ